MVPTLATPTAAAFIQEQARNTYCPTWTSQVGQPNTEFNIYHQGILVRKSTLDGAMLIVVATMLRQRIPTLTHYRPIAGHPWQQRIYYTLRHEFFWPRTAEDVYNTVDQCGSSTRNRHYYRHKPPLQPFSPSSRLNFVAGVPSNHL